MITHVTLSPAELIARALDDAPFARLLVETAIEMRHKRLRDLAWLIERRPGLKASVRVVKLDGWAKRFKDPRLPSGLPAHTLPRSQPGAMLVVYCGPEGVFAQHADR